MFFTVIRQFFEGEAESHSMEIKQTKDEALQRYFNIIATDLANPIITYNAAYIIDSNGLMIEGRVFNDSVPESESEVEG